MKKLIRICASKGHNQGALELLSCIKDVQTRLWVAANRQAPYSLLLVLEHDKDKAVRDAANKSINDR